MESPRRIAFLDLTCPKPYDSETASEEAIGGTEATVARVAEGLAEAGLEVSVAQHNRKYQSQRGKAFYCSLDELAVQKTLHTVIILRSCAGVPWAQTQWPNAKRILWAHDESYQDLLVHHDLLADAKCRILSVSRYHKQKIQDVFLSQLGQFPRVTVDYIYNPIADSLAPDATEWDVGLFVFFSSPHKGLDLTLKHWPRIKSFYANASLLIANPGYYEKEVELPEGVVNVGKLSHPDVLALVRRAEAVLHFNAEHPETFGLVHAEANAVGTPVLTSGIGANREVLTPYRDQVVDVTSIEAVLKRLETWRKEGRPQVSCRPEFRQAEVIKKWVEELKK